MPLSTDELFDEPSLFQRAKEFVGLGEEKPKAAVGLTTEQLFEEPTKSKSVEFLKNLGGETAALADMVLSLPGFAGGAVAGLGATAGRLVMGESPNTAYKTGREIGSTLSEPFMNPVKRVFDLFDSGKVYEDTKTVTGMNKFTELIQSADEYWNEKSGGKLPAGAFSQLVDTLMVGAIGAPKAVKVERQVRQMREALKNRATYTPDAPDFTVDSQGTARRPGQTESARAAETRLAEIDARMGELAGVWNYGQVEGVSHRAKLAAKNAELELEKLQAEKNSLSVTKPGTALSSFLVREVEKMPAAEEPRSVPAGKPRIKPKLKQEGTIDPDLMAALGLGTSLGALGWKIYDNIEQTGVPFPRVMEPTKGRPLDEGEPEPNELGNYLAMGIPFAAMGAVKGKGGAWHPEAPKRLLDSLAKNWDDRLVQISRASEGWLQREAAGDSRAPKELRTLEDAAKQTLETKESLSRMIRNWLNKHAGTATDPLKDIEIPYGDRTARWKDLTDEAIGKSTMPKPPGAKPDETIWALKQGYADRTTNPDALATIQSYLSHVGDYLRQNVSPEKLANYDLVRAVRETAAKDKEMARLAEKESAASMKDLPVYKDYTEQNPGTLPGMKWVELKLPEKLTEEQAKTVRPATLKETQAGLEQIGPEGEELSAQQKAAAGYIAVDSKGKPVVNNYTEGPAWGRTPEAAFLSGQLAKEGNQMGHCFPPGTIVNATIPLPIEQLEVGSEVISHTGSIRAVTKLFQRPFSGELVCIVNRGSLPIACTPEHPILIIRPISTGSIHQDRYISKRLPKTLVPTWTPAKELRAGDYLLSPGINSSISNNPDDLAWFFGVYAGDGDAGGGSGIGITCSPKDDIARIAKVIRGFGLEPKIKDKGTYIRIRAHSRELSQKFRSLFGESSRTKRIPGILFTDETNLREVLNGLLEADGTYMPRDRRWRFTSTSMMLVQQVWMIVVSLGYKPSLKPINRVSGYANASASWAVEWQEHEGKWHSNLRWNGFYATQITELKRVPYKGTVYNIEVAEDNSYLVNGLAVHNCVGGYCEGVASGESRIFSLRDAKGKGHVTVEVTNDNKNPATAMQLATEIAKSRGFIPKSAAAAQYELVDWVQANKELGSDKNNIAQIKGKQNRAPNTEYLPYVQDFVKSGKWGEVGDLQNTGLNDLNRLPAETRRMLDFGDQRFATDEEIRNAAPEALPRSSIYRGQQPRGPRGERGSASPELLRKMGAAGVGAAAGMTLADADDQVAGAILGGLTGLTIASGAGKWASTKSKTYRNVERMVEATISQQIRVWNPDLLSKRAESTASVLGKNMTAMMQRHLQLDVLGQTRRDFWVKQGEDASRKFLVGQELGKVKYKDPDLEQLSTYYKEWGKQIFDKDQAKNITYEPVSNYVYHAFEDPAGASAFLAKKYGAKWADPKFTRERSAQFITEAEKAGFRLKTYNPEELMQMRQHASDVAHMKIDALRELEQYGLARRIEKGDKAGPDEAIWRSPNGELFALGDHANQVFHNAFNTKSLWADPGLAGTTYRGAMWLKNLIVPIKLFSLFHPLHVQLGMSWADPLTATVKKIAAGKAPFTDYLKEALSKGLLLDVYKTPKAGWEIMKAWRGEIPAEKLTESQKRSLQLMVEGTFNPELSVEFKNQHLKAFRDAVAQRSLTAPFKLPFALLEKFWTRPIFEQWIPAVKTASYLRNAYAALEANPVLLTQPLERMNALRKLAKMTDDRFGEMQYKTLFMNRTVKDVSVGSFLSYGWQLGFLRSYVGAAPEAASAVMRMAEGKRGLRETIAKGELDKALFVGHYVMGTMLYGGLLTYALTGDAPRELLDYIFPRTGEKNPDGTNARVSTPFYTREFVSIPKHMKEEGVLGGLGVTVANKLSPAVGMMKTLITNRDFFNREISNPNDPMLQRLGQKLAFVFSEMEPIATSSLKRMPEYTAKDAALAGLGFSPAPKYVTESAIEADIRSLLKYHRPAITPFGRAQRSEDMHQLYLMKQAGKETEFDTQLDELKEKYRLSSSEVTRIKKDAAIPPSYRMFRMLTAEEQTRLLGKMDSGDKERFLPYARKRVRRELD